jgi:hypothetical protein
MCFSVYLGTNSLNTKMITYRRMLAVERMTSLLHSER